jgi:phage terminase large subunit-like protein
MTVRRTRTSQKNEGGPRDVTTEYAQAVVSGKIIAGSLVIGACKRHLADLKNGHKRGLIWQPDKADRAIGFFPAVLSITAGAKVGEPFNLLPWHIFVVGSLFGWYKSSGRRRFRNAWLETGKGQAKSPLMAAIGLYLLGFCGIARAEIYAIGWDKDTANVLFKDAVAMCRAPIPGGEGSDTLEARGEVVLRGTLDNAWKIEHPASGSKFQSLANGESISGPRPVAVVADEIHEFKGDAPIEIWKRAIAKMPGDALMLLGTNTPASTQIVGTNYSEFYQKVVRGEFNDDEAFAYIARVDTDDDPFEDESCWVKALPALGITFPIENMRGEVNTARILLSTALSVKRLYFGIPVGTAGFWIDEDAWVAVQGKVDESALRGQKCWLSLDLSQKNDLTALTAVWDDSEGFLSAKSWYWTVAEGLPDRALADQALYEPWVAQGFLTALPGKTIDKTFAAAQVARLCAEYDVQMLAFDPAGMADFERACADIGLEVWRYNGPDEPSGSGLMLVSHGQGKRVVFEGRQLCMPHSIERLEDHILNETIIIDDSPVTHMCAANAIIVSDGQNNRAFEKKRTRGRIDGVVTLAMAVGAASQPIQEKTDSRPQIFVL